MGRIESDKETFQVPILFVTSIYIEEEEAFQWQSHMYRHRAVNIFQQFSIA